MPITASTPTSGASLTAASGKAGSPAGGKPRPPTSAGRPPVAPDPDQEVQRDEHRLPEHVEQEEIERHEDADHARLEQQHEHDELAHALVDRAPGPQQAQRRQERGENHEPEREPVDPDVVADAPGGDPGVALLELDPSDVAEAAHEAP